MIGIFVWQCWGFAAGLLAEVLIVLDIPSILFGAMIMSDIWFEAFIALGIVLDLWIIARGRSDRTAIVGILLAAALFSLAILVRPLGIVLPFLAPLPCFFLPRFSWRTSVSIGLLAFAIPSLVTFAWMARNKAKTGVWTLSTDGPVVLYYFKAAGFVWYRGDESFPAVQDEFGRELGWPMIAFPDVPPSLQHEMVHRVVAIVRHDPAAAIAMTLRCFGWLAIVPIRGSLDAFLGTNAGAHSFLAASGNVRARIQDMLRSSLLTSLVLLQFVFMVFVWIGVARALARLRRKSAVERALVLAPFILALALLALATGPEAMARYRLPVMPLLAMIAAAGWFGKFESAELGSRLSTPIRTPEPRIAQGRN